jgi:hypothetical protein
MDVLGLKANYTSMTLYYPHCNQHKCYHTSGGAHHTIGATPAVAAPLPYFYMIQYEGSKKHRIKVRNVKGYSAEDQMQDHIRQHDAKDEWKRARWYVIGGLILLSGWFYIASVYVLPFLHTLNLY